MDQSKRYADLSLKEEDLMKGGQHILVAYKMMPKPSHGYLEAAGAISLRQSYECWKSGAAPIEYAKDHHEFARAFASFPGDADKLFPGWREKLDV